MEMYTVLPGCMQINVLILSFVFCNMHTFLDICSLMLTKKTSRDVLTDSVSFKSIYCKYIYTYTFFAYVECKFKFCIVHKKVASECISDKSKVRKQAGCQIASVLDIKT